MPSPRDEDDSDSEVSMRCEFVDSMAAESRSLQSDEGATSAFYLSELETTNARAPNLKA